MIERLRALLGDRAYAVADQAVFSVTSLVVTILVAQRLPAVDFGYFALEYAGYWLVLGALRSLVGEPVLIFTGRAAGSDHPFRYGGGPAATVLIAVVVGAATVVVGLATGIWSLVALAAVFPLVALQDCLRYVLLSLRGAGRALVGDLVGLAVIVGGGLLLRPDTVTVWWLIVGGGAVGGLLVQLPRVGIRFGATSAFLRETRTIGVRALVEFLVTSGVSQLVVFALPAVASVSAVAGLRAAQTLASPLNVLITAAGLVTLSPLSSRVTSGGLTAGLAFARRISLLLIAAAAACAVVVAVVPGSVWARVFGESWAFAGSSAPLLCLQQGAAAAGLFATYFLRVSGHASTSVRMRFAMSPLIVVCALLGGHLAGAEGAAVGLSASAVVVAAAYWVLAYRVTRNAGQGAVPAAVTVD